MPRETQELVKNSRPIIWHFGQIISILSNYTQQFALDGESAKHKIWCWERNGHGIDPQVAKLPGCFSSGGHGCQSPVVPPLFLYTSLYKLPLRRENHKHKKLMLARVSLRMSTSLIVLQNHRASEAWDKWGVSIIYNETPVSFIMGRDISRITRENKWKILKANIEYRTPKSECRSFV